MIKKCLQWLKTWRGSRRWAESESGVCFEHLGKTGRWSLLIAEPESLTVGDFRWPLSRSLSPSHPVFWLSAQALMACTCPALFSAAFFQQTLHQTFQKSAHVRSDCLVFPHPVPFFWSRCISCFIMTDYSMSVFFPHKQMLTSVFEHFFSFFFWLS